MYELVSGNKEVLRAVQVFGKYSNNIHDESDYRKFTEAVAAANIDTDFPVHSSVYNYVNGYGARYVIFNTLYSSLVCLENEREYDVYRGKLAASEAERNIFVRNGIWVNGNVDEREIYISFLETCHRFQKSNISVVLTTTLECNARCSYCYEAGVVKKDFDEHELNNLLKFLKEQDLRNGVQIIWFGGEPLLNTALIDMVSEAMTLEKIPFVSSLVTNGSLLTEYIVNNKFEKWHLNDIQVTFDGHEEKYEQIKNYVDKNACNYFSVLRNVKNAARTGINVHLRLNISKWNVADMGELLADLEASFGKYDNVSMYPAFVTGIDGVIPEAERISVLLGLLKGLKNPHKISFSKKFYGLPRVTPCHRFNSRAFSIDVNGNIYTCEHLVGRNEQSIGTLLEGLYKKDVRINPPPLLQECRNCLFLPKCCGGCESNREKGELPCMIEKYMIPAYIDFMLQETK